VALAGIDTSISANGSMRDFSYVADTSIVGLRKRKQLLLQANGKKTALKRDARAAVTDIDQSRRRSARCQGFVLPMRTKLLTFASQ
jgi:hypothetical protein